MDRPKEGVTCHHTGHKKLCSKLYMNCTKWINVSGSNPQTGEVINSYDCADVWVPVLLIENSKQQRGTQAAVESFRNEMAKDNRAVLQLAYTNQRLVE